MTRTPSGPLDRVIRGDATEVRAAPDGDADDGRRRGDDRDPVDTRRPTDAAPLDRIIDDREPRSGERDRDEAPATARRTPAEDPVVRTDGGDRSRDGAIPTTAVPDDERRTGELPGPAPGERPRPDGRRTAQGIRTEDAEDDPDTRRAVLSAIVRHEPGVLSRIAGLFARRKLNIESLTVGPTTDPDYARTTVVVEESAPGIEQAKAQLSGLIETVDVTELEADAVERELALVTVVDADADAVRAAAEAHDGTVVDAGPDAITVEVTGSGPEVDEAVDDLRAFPVLEVARPGPTALAPGPTPTTSVEATTGDRTATDDGQGTATDDAQGGREATGRAATDD